MEKNKIKEIVKGNSHEQMIEVISGLLETINQKQKIIDNTKLNEVVVGEFLIKSSHNSLRTCVKTINDLILKHGNMINKKKLMRDLSYIS